MRPVTAARHECPDTVPKRLSGQSGADPGDGLPFDRMPDFP